MDLFTDFILATGPADIGGAQGLQNLISRNSYSLKWMVQGGPGVKMCQGGSSIRGDVMIREVSTYTTYKPQDKQTWSNPQVTENYSCPWRFSLDHISWTDQEIMLNNATGPEYKDDVRIQAFIDMRKKVNMRGVTSLIHGMEDEMWALPDYDEMELTAGSGVQSLPLFSNEISGANGAGLYASYQSGNGGADTVQGIDKTTYSAWDNARASYAAVGQHATSHLFEAFDDVFMEVQYEKMPGIGAEYTDPISKPYVVATQKDGVIFFKRSLRLNQDWYRHGPDDPKYGAQFDGTQIEWIKALDTAPIYPTVTAAADTSTHTTYGAYDSTTNTTGGPRYHVLDFMTLHKICHSQRFFTYLPNKRPSNQATTNILPIDSWHNNFCRDLRRQACVYPSANIS